MPDTRPSISFVLVTPDRFDRIRKTVRCLQKQQRRDEIEVIVGAPSLANLGAGPAEFEGFHSHKLVEVGPIRSTGEPRVRASREATAPAIVFGEDHCFPQSGWAAAMIDAFQSAHTAIGPVFLNANPATATSWVSCVLNFGPLLMQPPDVQSSVIPWHNSGYRAELLLGYAPEELADLLEAEGLLQADLMQRGFSLHLCGSARSAHTNVSRFRSLCLEQFSGTRLFWHDRARLGAWPAWKRVVFVGASPALGLVRFRRALADFARLGVAHRLPAFAPSLAAGIACITLGAAVGMWPSLGTTMAQRVSAEFYRDRHLCDDDRDILVN